MYLFGKPRSASDTIQLCPLRGDLVSQDELWGKDVLSLFPHFCGYLNMG